MKDSTSISDRDLKWIEDYCNGQLSPSDFQEFERLMESRPELRAQFRSYMALDASLRDEVDAPRALSSPKLQPTRKSRIHQLVHTPWPWAVAAAIAIGLTALYLADIKSSSDSQISERSAEGFGVITGTQDCAWDGTSQFEPGDLAPTGPFRLISGSARIELFSGVTLIVEGDTSLELESAMRLQVFHGQIHASVPEPAHGFIVMTPDSQITDLGTEFAVRVNSNRSEAHVLNGEIQWNLKSAPQPESLITGEAVRWSGNQIEASIPANLDSFLDAKEFNDQLNTGRERRRIQWLASHEEFRADPRLLAYFGMDQSDDWTRQIPNRAVHNVGASNGTVVAAKPTVDRFGQPFGALDFSQAGSRVRLNIEQELKELTLLAWVRIDSLDRWYNSLLLTDGHELNEPHWQIMNDGRLFFSVKANDPKIHPKLKDKQVVYSPSFWNPTLSGKWIQIATTCDTRDGVVTHFLNGAILHQEVLEESMRVRSIRIGPATIGNWSEPTRNDPIFAIRNLNGSIDDFAIFNAALSPSEIAELYKIGKP